MAVSAEHWTSPLVERQTLLAHTTTHSGCCCLIHPQAYLQRGVNACCQRAVASRSSSWCIGSIPLLELPTCGSRETSMHGSLITRNSSSTLRNHQTGWRLPAAASRPGSLFRTTQQHRRASATMSACADCIKGSLDEGNPRGTDTTIAGVPCYLSQPPAAAANGCSIILATDVFGYKLINARLIADVYADAGFVVAVPDYFEGEPMNMQLLEAYESLPTQSFFGKITTGLQLALQVFNLGRWFQRHPFSHAVGVVPAVAAALRTDYGATKVGLQGYCYGGTVGILVASKAGVLDAVCSAHPGKVKVPEDVEGICTPILFICAESDAQFPEKTRTAVQQTLEAKSPGLSSFILYPGTAHGFAVRGNRRDAAVNAARQDALQQGLRFFTQHLVGGTPPGTLPADSAGTTVGRRLVLTPQGQAAA